MVLVLGGIGIVTSLPPIARYYLTQKTLATKLTRSTILHLIWSNIDQDIIRCIVIL